MRPTLASMVVLPLLLASCAAGQADQSQGRPAQPATQSDIPAPSAHLGRPLGADFQLADWNEVSSYYRLLGERSPNVETLRAGDTAEGRDFLIMIISSAANLANLDEIKTHARTLADPRGKSPEELNAAVENGKPIVFISCQMHSTETAGSQFSMELAHTLATSDEEPWRSAREKLVVVIYTTNPDGVDEVTKWYRQHVGSPYEATDLLRLYQLYSGHDNNRDWFMLTQNETRIVTELLYKQWFPTVYWDVHQQGSNEERMFVPPYRDPLNPNLDPGIITAIDSIGSRALMDMTRAGFKGISTGVSYDMWWNGGNRNVPVRHNIVGILTEAASVDIATPMFLPRSELRPPSGLGSYEPSNQFPAPWPGGWWRLRDIINYEMAFARSLLATLNREPEIWLRNALEASQRTIETGKKAGPRAWLIPADNRDPGAVRRLVDVLLKTGVELSISEGELTADGRTYPAGTLVIRRDQPYSTHVKDLFDVQRYPEGAPPYDVAGWTLPYLLGVRRVEVMAELPAEANLRRIERVEDAVAVRAQDGGALSSRDSDTWKQVFDALEGGKQVRFDGEQGTFDVFEASAVTSTQPERPRRDEVTVTRLPRIGLYSPWSGSMDEGWMRWVLETWGVPYVSVKNEMLRAGQLGDFLDVLIVPAIGGRALDDGRAPGTIPDEYARGLAPEGAVAIEEFVREGGTLITFDSSSDWAIQLFELPLVNVTRERENRDFNCPGSVLRAIPVPDSGAMPFTADLPSSVPLFFSGSGAYRDFNERERREAGLDPRGGGVGGGGGGGGTDSGTQPSAAAGSGQDYPGAPSGGAAGAPARGGAAAVGEQAATRAAPERRDAQWGPRPQTLLRYAPERVLLSGWIRQPEAIENRAAWVRAEVGDGAVHLFAFRPQYRGWSQSTFPLVFRAMLFEERIP